MLDKTYRPAEVEARIYAEWEAGGAFAPRGDGEPYCIMMPPPNVTGSLHMGHALDHTIQDTLVRFERMRGRDGAVAARHRPRRHRDPDGGRARSSPPRATRPARARPRGVRRRGLGVEGGIGRHHHRQMRRLGASPDWSRERFTMDEGLSRAVVRKVFVGLYKAGLIYKDKRLVNWDCQLQTAVSDLEVQQHEVDGHSGHLRYPIEGTEGEFITVATTRPETMLGDTAVAVHPEDERYRHLLGRHAVLPLVGRRIPIVADAYLRPREGHRRGQDHARARLQRLRGRPPPRARDDHRDRRRGPINDERAGGLPRPRPVRGAQAGRRRPGGAGPAREGRAAPAHGARTATARARRSSRC